MDLSKAVDTFNHELLITNLAAYGFSNPALKLIQTYLNNRWQGVKVNNIMSSWIGLL